jgi:glucose-1-phosphate cytidylyltransferase
MLPKDTPVIILCGGEGSRIADVSRDAVPKPLIRIGDRPILWHIMKIYEAHGFSNFILALGHLGWEIKDYFLNERLMDCDLLKCFASRPPQNVRSSLRKPGKQHRRASGSRAAANM